MKVNGPRLLGRIAELAAIGADPSGGVTRLAYSPEETAARTLVAKWAANAGLYCLVDAGCNLVATSEATGLAPLAMGSHLDSVVNAGHLDGAYGVVAAVEVATALYESGHALRHPLLVVGFSNEEGARGTPGFAGSLVVAGDRPDVSSVDDEGVTLGQRLRDAGGDPDALAGAAWTSLAGYLELHIEQGPVLEAEGTAIGVVDAITGRVNLEVEIAGQPQHAGTTPMALRRDAMVAAAHVVLAVEALAVDGHVRVATAGRIEVTPGVRNTVPGAARLSCELRDTSAARMAAAVAILRASLEGIGKRTGCSVVLIEGPSAPGVPTDTVLQQCFADAASALGLSQRTMPSGAGHDAQIVARVGPVGMCFVPSTGGVSHAPQEASADADLIAGAQVLLDALLLADARLSAG